MPNIIWLYQCIITPFGLRENNILSNVKDAVENLMFIKELYPASWTTTTSIKIPLAEQIKFKRIDIPQYEVIQLSPKKHHQV